MRTFPKTRPRRRVRARGAVRAARARLARLLAGGEDGFLLVEVMISAVLVALIVTATFNGLDVATRLSSEQRHRNQAELLAAASQEQMRSEPATALDELVGAPHTYTREVSGVKYTIKQSAETVSASGKKTGCSVVEATASTAANFRVVSTVTWSQQEKGHRPAVTQSGVISPPTGSGIEVDVINGASTGVPGVTARAKFIPNESGSYTTVEGTTSSAGCVVLSGIQSTEATVEILQKTGYVTPSGALVPPAKALTIAPNYTSHYVVAYAEAGAIQAKFVYKGSTSWEGKTVKSDTFVAANSEKMETAPEYEVGSTVINSTGSGEEPYVALTGSYSNAGTKPEPFTAKFPKYPNGDLFPFASAWTVFAGDCPANNTTAEDLASGAVVTSGNSRLVEIPMSITKLLIYTGKGKGETGSLVSTSLKNSKGGSVVKITNTGCEGEEAPNNSTALNYTHGQTETLPGTTKGGMLENPFQPAGKFKLCLVSNAEKETFSLNYENSPALISEPKIYLKQRQTAAVSAERVEKEALYKTEEAAYNAAVTKYKEKETAYKTKEAAYKAKEANKEKNKEAETKKKEYETKKAEYEAKKKQYETKKTEYENKKKEYEKTFKASYKTEYEKFKTEYETFKTEYEALATAYKKLETEYKKAETEYNEYAVPKAEYETLLAEYKKYKEEAVEDKAEYEAAKTAWEKAKTEEKEASESGVTVKSGEEC